MATTRRARSTDITDARNVSFRAPQVWAILATAVLLVGSVLQMGSSLSTKISESEAGLKSDIRDISTRMTIAADADLKLREAETRARVSEADSMKQRFEGLQREFDELRRNHNMLRIDFDALEKEIRQQLRR